MLIKLWLFLLCLWSIYILTKKGIPISECLKTAYLHYFGFSVSNQDKKWISMFFVKAIGLLLYAELWEKKSIFTLEYQCCWEKLQTEKIFIQMIFYFKQKMQVLIQKINVKFNILTFHQYQNQYHIWKFCHISPP